MVVRPLVQDGDLVRACPLEQARDRQLELLISSVHEEHLPADARRQSRRGRGRQRRRPVGRPVGRRAGELAVAGWRRLQLDPDRGARAGSGSGTRSGASTGAACSVSGSRSSASSSAPAQSTSGSGSTIRRRAPRRARIQRGLLRAPRSAAGSPGSSGRLGDARIVDGLRAVGLAGASSGRSSSSPESPS